MTIASTIDILSKLNGTNSGRSDETPVFESPVFTNDNVVKQEFKLKDVLANCLNPTNKQDKIPG